MPWVRLLPGKDGFHRFQLFVTLGALFFKGRVLRLRRNKLHDRLGMSAMDPGCGVVAGVLCVPEGPAGRC